MSYLFIKNLFQRGKLLFSLKIKIFKKTQRNPFSVGFLGVFLGDFWVFLGGFFLLPTLAPGGRAHLSRLPHGDWSRGLSPHLLVQVEDDEHSRLLLLVAGEGVSRVKCLKTHHKRYMYHNLYIYFFDKNAFIYEYSTSF